MRRFFLLVIFTIAFGLMFAGGWEASFWFLVAAGLMCFVIYAVVDLTNAIWRWLDRRQEIEIKVYDQEAEAFSAKDIIDAEIVKEEGDRKWWRV